jgi:hypothetical protein
MNKTETKVIKAAEQFIKYVMDKNNLTNEKELYEPHVRALAVAIRESKYKTRFKTKWIEALQNPFWWAGMIGNVCLLLYILLKN